MNCERFQHRLDDYLDDLLEAPDKRELENHIESCAACAATVEREGRLRRELRHLPFTPPSPGFGTMALRYARRAGNSSRQKSWVAGALAASLALGIAIGHFGGGPAEGLAKVALQVDEPRALNLAFDAPRSFEGAVFAMTLPPGIELVGRPGQREVVWQADLKQGRNVLTLPLVARRHESGEVLAEIRHGAEVKRFVLHVGVQSANDRRSSAVTITTT